MKKFLVTILAFVYLTSAVGATVRLDCCLEKLVQVGLITSMQENQWLEEDNSNCKDDHKQDRLGHEQKRTDSKIRVAKYVPPCLNTDYPDSFIHSVTTLTEAYPVNNAPPQQAIIPLFILHCVQRL
jgi:hypothetical protein